MTIRDFISRPFCVSMMFVVSLAAYAHALDLPVRYLVDGKALKDAVSGTSLTFELHTDSSCSSIVQTTNQSIDAVTFVSRLKGFKPVGGTRPPKTAELNHTLNGVPGVTPLYLRVTGTGIAPIGPACQAQAAGAGAQGPAGPAGPSNAYATEDPGPITVPDGGAPGLILDLDLPAGSYLLFARVEVQNDDGLDSAVAYCHLTGPGPGGPSTADDTAMPLGTISPGHRTSLVLQAPQNCDSACTVSLSCTNNTMGPGEVAVTRAKLSAIQVGSLTEQP